MSQSAEQTLFRKPTVAKYYNDVTFKTFYVLSSYNMHIEQPTSTPTTPIYDITVKPIPRHVLALEVVKEGKGEEGRFFTASFYSVFSNNLFVLLALYSASNIFSFD